MTTARALASLRLHGQRRDGDFIDVIAVLLDDPSRFEFLRTS
jgi:hypothetical protein